jgi:hypothetical protein
VHERSIWQVLFIYLGGSGALLGNADLVMARFGFPEWLFSASLALVILGFIGVLAIKVWPKVRRAEEMPRAIRDSLTVAGMYLVVALFAHELAFSYLRETTHAILSWVILALWPIVVAVAYWSQRRGVSAARPPE